MLKNEIIGKARKLSELINRHPIALNYHELREKISADKKSQNLLSQLILLGEKTNESILHGAERPVETSAEFDILKQELDENILVKNFILAQKEYLNLINLVTQRIKDPQ